MLVDLCSELGVICVEEHWLALDSVNCLNNFNNDLCWFVIISYGDSLGKNILRGSPFGELVTFVNKQRVHKTTCMTRKDRYLILTVVCLII